MLPCKEVDPQEVIDFLYDHGSYSLRMFWKYPQIEYYVKYHLGYGQMAVIYQADGSIVGVGVARRINRRKTSHLREKYVFRTTGNTIHMERLAVLHPAVIPRLHMQMVKALGKAKWVSAYRHGVFHYWPYEKYLLKAAGILSRMTPRDNGALIQKHYETVPISQVHVDLALTPKPENHRLPVILTRKGEGFMLLSGHHHLEFAQARGDIDISAEVLEVPKYLEPDNRITIARIREKYILSANL